MANNNFFICFDSVYETIINTNPFPTFYGFINYKQVLEKFNPASDLYKYVVSYKADTREYVARPIQHEQLLTTYEYSEPEYRLLYDKQKQFLYTAEQIKIFRGFTENTKILYFEQADGTFIDISIFRKRLYMIYLPIFINLNLQVKWMKMFEASKLRYKMAEKHDDLFKKNVDFKLQYAILVTIGYRVYFAYPLLFNEFKDLSIPGKWQLIARTCCIYPKYLNVVIFFLNNGSKFKNLNECLKCIEIYDHNLDIGICLFILKTLFPAFDTSSVNILGLVGRAFNQLQNLITNQEMNSEVRNLRAFFNLLPAGIKSPQEIPKAGHLTCSTQFPFFTDQYDFAYLFSICGQTIPDDCDYVNDFDKDEKATFTSVHVDGLKARVGAIDLNDSVIMNYCLTRLCYAKKCTYSLVYAVCFGQPAFVPGDAETHRYNIAIPSLLYSGSEEHLKDIEMAVIAEIMRNLPLDPDITHNSTDTSTDVFHFTIRPSFDSVEVSKPVHIYQPINQNKSIFNFLRRFPDVYATFYFENFNNLNIFDKSTSYDTKMLQEDGNYISNYEFGFHLNHLWLRTGDETFIKYANIKIYDICDEIKTRSIKQIQKVVEYIGNIKDSVKSLDFIKQHSDLGVNFKDLEAKGLYFNIGGVLNVHGVVIGGSNLPIHYDETTVGRIKDEFDKSTSMNPLWVYLKVMSTPPPSVTWYVPIYGFYK